MEWLSNQQFKAASNSRSERYGKNMNHCLIRDKSDQIKIAICWIPPLHLRGPLTVIAADITVKIYA